MKGPQNFGRQLSMLASGVPDKGVGVRDIYRHGLLRKLVGRAFQRREEQLGNVSPGALQVAEQRHRAKQSPIGEKVLALSQFREPCSVSGIRVRLACLPAPYRILRRAEQRTELCLRALA